ADIGAVIDWGSNAKELFHVAVVHKLGVFVNVPEVYARVAQTGLQADITLKEFPGRRFTGTLVRNASSIDLASRTLLTEIDVDNPKGELLPGSYAEVHLKLPAPTATLQLPVSALIFKSDGLQVAALRNGERVALMEVPIGRDFGNTVEITGGGSPDERVIVNPPDSLVAGQTVRIAPGTATSGSTR